jgi:hypothetical protein
MLHTEAPAFTLERFTLETKQGSHPLNRELPKASQWVSPPLPSYEKIFVKFASPFLTPQKDHTLSEDIFFEEIRKRCHLFGVLYDETDLTEIPDIKLHYQVWKKDRGAERRKGTEGIIASFHMDRCSALDAWFPYLMFGEKFHIGEETVLGLGNYTLWIK